MRVLPGRVHVLRAEARACSELVRPCAQAVLILAAALPCIFGCTRSDPGAPAHAPLLTEELRGQSSHPPAEAARCAPCHAEEVAAWSGSQHADANRPVFPELDGQAFREGRLVPQAGLVRAVGWDDGMPFFHVVPDTGGPERHVPEAVIGREPLRQFLVPFPGGRWQVVDLAYDPTSREWFNAQDPIWGDRDWGHWRNRGMNWNSQCASCHMTGLEKGYAPETDSYRTTWAAMGISCAQCHGSLEAHVTSPRDSTFVPRFPPDRISDTCASCHARREELTGTFQPGDRFDDHYRLSLPDQANLYYADGQVREEVFEFGSFRLSRMGHRGIRCLDCHDPHSGDLTVPVENNGLCATCHAAPGEREATVVDFSTHGHHPPGSRGNLCVECHMPVTKYMVRDPRRDHGFTIPDPLLTVELGIPNACSRCHGDRTPEWAAGWTETWYGERMERPARRRARAIARAEEGDSRVLPELLELTAAEEIPAWRATLVGLLLPWGGRPEVDRVIRDALGDSDPLVRAAALKVLGSMPADPDLLRRAQADDVRLVRLDASWIALRQGFPVADRTEVLRYLHLGADQPAGALRMAQLALAENRPGDAEVWARRAADGDRGSAESRAMLGRVLHAIGRIQEAVESLEEAVALDPEDAELRFTLALLFGELGRNAEVLPQLERAVSLDPEFERAWYNLGLVYAQGGHLEDALRALDRAASLGPGSPDAPYARATILIQTGDLAGAERDLREALARDPSHEPASQLLEEMKSRVSGRP